MNSEAFECWVVRENGIYKQTAYGKDSEGLVHAESGTWGYLGSSVFLTELEALMAHIQWNRLIIQRHALKLNKATIRLRKAIDRMGELTNVP